MIVIDWHLVTEGLALAGVMALGAAALAVGMAVGVLLRMRRPACIWCGAREGKPHERNCGGRR